MRETHEKTAKCGHTVTYLLAEGTSRGGREANERVLAREAPEKCRSCIEGKSKPKA